MSPPPIRLRGAPATDGTGEQGSALIWALFFVSSRRLAVVEPPVGTTLLDPTGLTLRWHIEAHSAAHPVRVVIRRT